MFPSASAPVLWSLVASPLTNPFLLPSCSSRARIVWCPQHPSQRQSYERPHKFCAEETVGLQVRCLEAFALHKGLQDTKATDLIMLILIGDSTPLPHLHYAANSAPYFLIDSTLAGLIVCVLTSHVLSGAENLFYFLGPGSIGDDEVWTGKGGLVCRRRPGCRRPRVGRPLTGRRWISKDHHSTWWRGRIRECLDEMLNGSGGNIREVTLSHVAGDIFVEMRRTVFYSRAS